MKNQLLSTNDSTPNILFISSLGTLTTPENTGNPSRRLKWNLDRDLLNDLFKE